MDGTLPLFSRESFPDTTASISSPASADLKSPLGSQDGQTARSFGPAVFPARLFPSPDAGKERETTATSGRNLSGLFEDADPNSFSSRMSRRLIQSPIWFSTECSLTWKRSTTKRGRLKYRLVPSMRPTNGTEFGLWPTVRASDGAKGGPGQEFSAGGQTLPAVALSLWPTVTSRDHKSGAASAATLGRNARPLNEVAQALWATTTAKGSYNRAGLSPRSGDGLATQAYGAISVGLPATTADFAAFRSGFLIRLSCWLMGYPPELLRCMASATASCRKSRRKS